MNFPQSFKTRGQVRGLNPFNYRARSHDGSARDVIDARECLSTSRFGMIEFYSVSSAKAPPFGFSSRYQFAFPIYGAHTWKVGGRSSLIDPNNALFVRGGEEFSETHPIHGVGHSALIVTPSGELLDELKMGRKSTISALFSADTRPIDPISQLRAHRLATTGHALGRIEIEELSIQLVEQVLEAKPPAEMRGTKRLIDRAKDILHNLDCEPLTLSDIATELGVTPIYLTQAFKKSEGLPLYRYQSRLRMNRALAELPFSRSLTELAFDLGYSSHSHFAAAFRSNFGISPSRYRKMSGFV